MIGSLLRNGNRTHCVLFGMLFVGLSTTEIGRVTWPHCLRLLALLVLVVGGGWSGHSNLSALLLTSALVAGAAELFPPTDGLLEAAVWLLLLILAVAGAIRVSQERPAMDTLGWTVGGVFVGVLGLFLAVAALYELSDLWAASLQWILYAAVWLALRSWLVGLEVVDRRWLVVPVATALLIVCMVGGIGAGKALYQLLGAERLEADGDHAAVATRYRAAWEQSQRLGLVELQERARSGLARAFLKTGDLEAGNRALGLRADGVIVVEPSQWEGPTGAKLFKNVSSWVDVWLKDGLVSVDVHARAYAARGELPRICVELAGVELGEVKMSPPDDVATFRTQVSTGRHRLKVRLENGFWTSGGEHRWAHLGRAEIRYEATAE